MSISATIEKITPKIAADYLEKNITNRRLDPVRIATYKEDILNGCWQLNGESIKFDCDGNMIDGQHRLMAIIKAGIPVQIVVMRDIDASSVLTIDTGRNRTFSDFLTLKRGVGAQDAASIAQALKYIICYDNDIVISSGGGGGQPIQTTNALENLYTRNGTELKNLLDTLRSLAKSNARICPLSSALSLYFILYCIDADKSHAFIKKVYGGYGIEPLTPESHLREMMLNQRTPGKKKTVSNSDFVYLGIKAWNSIRRGRPIKFSTNLRIKPDEEKKSIKAF